MILDEDMLVRLAIMIATEKHKGQKRRNGEPYIQHPMRVLKMLQDLKVSANIRAAGVLHDVIEDTDMTAKLMLNYVPQQVVDLVVQCSKLEDGSFPEWSKEARLIKLCDAFDNVTDTDARSFSNITRYAQKKRVLFGINSPQPLEGGDVVGDGKPQESSKLHDTKSQVHKR